MALSLGENVFLKKLKNKNKNKNIKRETQIFTDYLFTQYDL